MRSSFLLVLGGMLLPAAGAAQIPPAPAPATKEAPRTLAGSRQEQAVATALAKVRSDLVSDHLLTWGGGTGGGIKPSTLAVAGALFNPTGGISRTGVYVVAVTAPNAKGHVRVVINGSTGEVLSTRLASWDWGAAPTWWRQGRNAAPAP